MSETIYKNLADIAAEESVLGAAILKPSILGWLDLRDGHFTKGLHLTVFHAVRAMFESGRPVDEITLIDEVSRLPGVDLLAVSKLMVRVPTADNAEHWVQILEEHRRKRVLMDVAASVTAKLGAGDMSGEIQDSMLSGLSAIEAGASSIGVTLEEAADDELARMEDQWGGGSSSRIETGITRLDGKIGGLPIGTPTALGARPGVGKSTTLWNICNNVCKRGEHSIILTNEDRPHVQARLAIANAAGIERRRLVQGILTPEEKDKVRAAVDSIRDANSRYHVVRVHGKKMREICREAKAIIRRHGAKLVAVDYIQNVPNPEPGMSRNYGIEENMTMFEAMIADEGVAGILVGQLKRIEDSRRPLMQDFKDSGSIEQKCKLMMILSEGANADVLDVDIVKNSEGVSGFTISLACNKGTGRFL